MTAALAQGIHVLATALMAGALIFALLPLPSAAIEGGRGGAAASASRNVMRLIVVAFGVAVAADILWLWSVAAGMSGIGAFDSKIFGAIGSVLMATSFGRLWVARACTAVVLGFLLLRQVRNPGGPSGSTTLLAAALALALLASVAAAGHAAASAHPKMEIAVLAMHVSAVGIWFGGLAALRLSLRAAARAGGAESFAADATCRFGTLALYAIAVLAAFGAVSAFFRLSGIAAISSDYGKLLIAKSGLFAAALTLAAINRWRLLPRLSGIAGTAEARRCALLSLVRNVEIETMIVGAILLLAGWLAATSPA